MPVRRWRAPLLLVATALVLAACGSSGTAAPTNPTNATSTTSTGPISTGPNGSAGSPPAVPTSGAYLGAWLHPVPAGVGGPSFAVEQQALPSVRAATGRALGILHIYVAWGQRPHRSPTYAPSPPPVRSRCSTGGACPTDPRWPGEQDDALISSFADALRSYGGPVLLRWCWEMNLVDVPCRGRGSVGLPPPGCTSVRPSPGPESPTSASSGARH